MARWKRAVAGFFNVVHPPLFGAGFRKDNVDVAGHPNLISFDGCSVYFFGLRKIEADRLLDGVTLLNGRTGWLAYMLQELYYDQYIGDNLYGEIYSSIDSGAIPAPPEITCESIYRWVEDVAQEVEKIIWRMRKD